MSLLNPVLMLNGKRKEIFDFVFEKNVENNFEIESNKMVIANILLDYDDSKLDELKEEVINSNNPVELLINKGKELDKGKIVIPSNIQI